MPRNFNQELRNDLLDIIKRKWFINNQQVFSCSLQELANESQKIAEGRGEERKARGEQIMHYINALELGGWIKVHRGKGNESNQYEFIEDNIIQQSQTKKEELTHSLEEYVDQMNSLMRYMIASYSARIQEIQEMIGEVHYLKNEIKNLKVTAIGLDGNIMFEAPKNSSLPIIIEQISKENKESHDKIEDNHQ